MFKNTMFLLLLINLSILIKTSTVYTRWTPELLYDYTRSNTLNYYNNRYNFNINYMIIDPENYLNNVDLSDLVNKMKKIYDEYKINIYIIFISELELNGNYANINNEVERFVSYFNYYLQKGNGRYNDSMSLTTAFFIKQRKMRMRTGKYLREIITDEKALDILDARKYDLRNENYYNVVEKLLDDIIYKYDHNSSIFDIIFLLIIIFGTFYFIFSCNKPEKERVKKIKEFLKENKDKQLKTVFNDSCIICLENLEDKNENLKDREITKDKEQEKEKENIAVLECGHRFHEKCIIEWLKKHNICPICRVKQKIGNDDNNKNYESRLLGDDYNFIIDVQTDAYPQEITVTEGNRIISDLNNPNTNNSDFDSFDADSGGATSDW